MRTHEKTPPGKKKGNKKAARNTRRKPPIKLPELLGKPRSRFVRITLDADAEP
jgi:hypothetical protein